MYIELKDLLADLIRTNVPTIKSIDWYNDQYRNTEKKKAELYPAVYIEVLDPQSWESGSDGLQFADMRIQLHCVIFNLKDEPNAIMELTQTIYLGINNKALYRSIDNKQFSSPLTRVSSEFVKNYNQLKVMKLGFRFGYFDESNCPVLQEVNNVSFKIN
jgi:hypothetical protein